MTKSIFIFCIIFLYRGMYTGRFCIWCEVMDMRYMEAGSKICSLVAVVSLSFLMAGCAGKSSREWDDIDYSKVRDRDKYENDDNYTQPSVVGCTNDDLFNCN